MPVSSVLIVDDEPSMRSTLAEIFSLHGASHIRVAGSAEEALNLLEEEPFSLIICDHRLPGMSGLAFLGKIRLQKDQTPMILITGMDHDDSLKTSANQLKAGFLEKPFSPDQLIAAAEQVLQ